MQHTVAELIAQVTHPDYRTRVRAVVALGDSRDPHAIPALLDALSEYDRHDGSSRVNTRASDALAKMGEPALLPLIAALHERRDHPDDSWRRNWVADALGMLGDPRAVEPLIMALDDVDVRESAAEALGRIGDIRALESLERLLPVAQATAWAAIFSHVAWAIRQIRDLHGLPIPSAHEAHRDLLMSLLGIADQTDQAEHT
jgi:HEAT repeat protein